VSGGANILVIDDDEIMLQLIEDLLTKHGHTVTTMASPIGATQTIYKENINLVVVDWRMPVMQGDRLVSLLRSWERGRELPVILISGTSRDSLEQVAAGLQGVVIVPKAEMNHELPAAIKSMLKSALSTTSDVKRRSPTTRTSRGEVESFYDRLAKRIQDATELWKQITQGDTRFRELDFLIDTVHGQAQLLGLNDMAQLMSAIHDVTHKVAEGRTPSFLVHDAVARALKVAASMPNLQTEGITVDVAPLIEKLRAAGASLS
jgi:CheY-like chemotaxis protein